MMRQRVHLITLGVDDLETSSRFYDALGWSRVSETPPGIVAYDLYGATLGLYPRADLARDMGRDLPKGSGALTLACNVRDKGELDTVIAAARRSRHHPRPPRRILGRSHRLFRRPRRPHLGNRLESRRSTRQTR